MIYPPDLPELVPSVPKGEREPSRPEVIILGDGDTEPENAFDKGTRDGDDTRLDNEPTEFIDPTAVKWFGAVHNGFAGHNGIDETVRRLFI